MIFVVEVWCPGDDIASNRYIGPFRSLPRAEEYAEKVRHAFGEQFEARVLDLESGQDDRTWLGLREAFDRGTGLR